jgi:hypothetical protein
LKINEERKRSLELDKKKKNHKLGSRNHWSKETTEKNVQEELIRQHFGEQFEIIKKKSKQLNQSCAKYSRVDFFFVLCSLYKCPKIDTPLEYKLTEKKM